MTPKLRIIATKNKALTCGKIYEVLDFLPINEDAIYMLADDRGYVYWTSPEDLLEVSNDANQANNT